jgi:hypothetical protein
VLAQVRPVVAFLGYDPILAPISLADRVEAKRRSLGAGHIRWMLGYALAIAIRGRL